MLELEHPTERFSKMTIVIEKSDILRLVAFNYGIRASAESDSHDNFNSINHRGDQYESER